MFTVEIRYFIKRSVVYGFSIATLKSHVNKIIHLFLDWSRYIFAHFIYLFIVLMDVNDFNNQWK